VDEVNQLHRARALASRVSFRGIFKETAPRFEVWHFDPYVITFRCSFKTPDVYERAPGSRVHAELGLGVREVARMSDDEILRLLSFVFRKAVEHEVCESFWIDDGPFQDPHRRTT
jgi:hypothetical protein